jgi:hypothetical protein
MTFSTLEYKAVIQNISTFRNDKMMTASEIPYTSEALIEEITLQLPLHKDSSIAVMFTIEWAIYLKQVWEQTNITVVVDAEDKVVRNVCKWFELDYIVYHKGMKLKKFDIVVGNPPFSKGDTLLYTRFYKLALEIADVVTLIMPYDIASKQIRLRAHNNLVKTHTLFTSENIVSNFKINLLDVRYVISSKNVINEFEDDVDPLEDIENLYPTRRRVIGLRGKMPAQFISKVASENTDTTISSIYRGDEIQYAQVTPAFTKAKTRAWQTDAPYLLLINENPSRGLFNTAIIENDGTTWGSGIFAIECQSKEEAEDMRAHITSPEIVAEVARMLEAKGTYSFSGVMLSKLPWVK